MCRQGWDRLTQVLATERVYSREWAAARPFVLGSYAMTEPHPQPTNPEVS